MLLALMLACTPGPPLEGHLWELLEPLPGEPAELECQLAFSYRADANLLDWTDTCGREDLPLTAQPLDHRASSGWLYRVGGLTPDAGGLWLTRDTVDADDLFELWLYPLGSGSDAVLDAPEAQVTGTVLMLRK